MSRNFEIKIDKRFMVFFGGLKLCKKSVKSLDIKLKYTKIGYQEKGVMLYYFGFLVRDNTHHF